MTVEYIALFKSPPPEACHAREISIMDELGEEHINRCTISRKFSADDDEEAKLLAGAVARHGGREVLRLYEIAHEVELESPLLVER